MTKKKTVKKVAKKKTTKRVVKKLPKVYTFLGLKLKELYRKDLWFVAETLSNGELLYVELEKRGKDFSAVLEYNGIVLEAPISSKGELALQLLLEELQNMINPLVELGL